MTTASSILLIMSGFFSLYATYEAGKQQSTREQRIISKMNMYLRSVTLLSCGYYLYVSRRYDEPMILISIVAAVSSALRAYAMYKIKKDESLAEEVLL